MNDEKLSFVNSNGNTATSSLNMLTNVLHYYEKGFRSNKIGIPGWSIFYCSSLPQNVEGFYSQYFSKTLTFINIESTRKLFTGESFSSLQTGSSLVTYLIF